MAFYNTKQTKYTPAPVPSEPGYVPPTPPTPPSPEPGNVPVIPSPVFTGDTTITLYNTYDDNNVIDKTLLSPMSFDISFKMDTSILRPVVLIESATDISSFNYMYIESVNRYYFINSIEYLPGGIYRVSAKVDVLKTFADGIKGMNGIVVKAEDSNYINEDLNDGSFVNQEGAFIQLSIYDNGFDEKPTNILVVAGGGATT